MAKIGKSKVKAKNIGIFGLGTRNERGDKLEEVCMTNNLIVGNLMFQHHPTRLWTWVSPGDGVRNQIDYIRLHIDWFEMEISSAKCQNTTWSLLWKRPSTAFGKNEVKTES